MDFTNLWSVILVLALIVPLFFWLRLRTGRRKKEIIACCKQCGKEHEFESIRNFKCTECGSINLFLDEDGKPLKMLRTYQCDECGNENFVGILTCSSCGKTHKERIPT